MSLVAQALVLLATACVGTVIVVAGATDGRALAFLFLAVSSGAQSLMRFALRR